MANYFTEADFHNLCDKLGATDRHFAAIIDRYGYPPFWSRPNTFETLVQFILEQQVSLASALSALNKLKARLGELTPRRTLLLTDEEMRACYVSRQKSGYIKHLAGALLSGQLNLEALEGLPDGEVRRQLMALKGIGNWTADVYLIFVAHHPDVFPAGDLAAVNAVKRIKGLPAIGLQEVLEITATWQPYRTVATMLLWHFYLSVPRNSLLAL